MSTEEAIRRLTDIGRTIAAQGKTSEEVGKNFIALEMAIDALQEQKEAEDEADFWKRRSKEYGDISSELIKKTDSRGESKLRGNHRERDHV